MQPFHLKSIAIICSYLLTGNSYASLINHELLTPHSLTHIYYTNPLKNTFSSINDGFQIYQRDVGLNIPNALLDNSEIATSDRLGIISSTNTQAFFGIVDAVNLNNPIDDALAKWQINIKNLSALTFFIDMAAMGDFENSDQFIWRYSIDNNPFSTIFQGISDEDTLQNYRLEDNSLIDLNDPMTVDSRLLSNEFKAFSSSILGTGSLLTLELKAKVNGGSEVIAFQNIVIQGVSNAVTVGEPKSYAILLLALLFFIKRKIIS
jgi:hypothetical protein